MSAGDHAHSPDRVAMPSATRIPPPAAVRAASGSRERSA